MYNARMFGAVQPDKFDGIACNTRPQAVAHTRSPPPPPPQEPAPVTPANPLRDGPRVDLCLLTMHQRETRTPKKMRLGVAPCPPPRHRLGATITQTLRLLAVDFSACMRMLSTFGLDEHTTKMSRMRYDCVTKFFAINFRQFTEEVIYIYSFIRVASSDNDYIIQ